MLDAAFAWTEEDKALQTDFVVFTVNDCLGKITICILFYCSSMALFNHRSQKNSQNMRQYTFPSR